MPDQINYRRHGLVNASSITLATADFGLLDAEDLSDAAFETSMPALDGATIWLNSLPLTTEGLRGKVVAVEFWTYTCINWLRTLPYSRAWAEKYQDAGLVVIGVHTPEFPFEHDLENVRRAVQEMRVAYSVAVDNEYAVWSAFDNHYWPALYLADAQGRIRHHQFGEGDYDEAERIIQQLLAEAGDDRVAQDLVAVDARGAEVAADWNNLASEENYVGYERTESFASPGGAVLGARHVYAIPARLERNEWALAGEWAHRLPLPRPRCAPGHGTRRAGYDRALPCAQRWPGAGTCAWQRRGRAGQRCGERAAAVSTDPPTETDRRPNVRDRVPRRGRGGVRVHIWVIHGRWRCLLYPWTMGHADARG